MAADCPGYLYSLQGVVEQHPDNRFAGRHIYKFLDGNTARSLISVPPTINERSKRAPVCPDDNIVGWILNVSPGLPGGTVTTDLFI